MKFIDKDIIYKLVYEAIPKLACQLPEDISAAIREMNKCENSKVGKSVLAQLCKNEKIARYENTPICQDTGTVRVMLELGTDISISGDVFSRVDEAVAKAYNDEHLRLSVVEDAVNDRTNTGDNTPAFCEIVPVGSPGTARLNIMLKGGGSDNASCVKMLNPGQGIQGIIDTVVGHVKEKAANACPPLIIGIGIGGTFDNVASLAQRALFRPVGTYSKDLQTAKLEKEILKAINKTNIGAGALGGKSTAIQVSIITSASHIASMPLAIDMGCCAMRRASIDIPCKSFDDKDNGDIPKEKIDFALSKAFASKKSKDNEVSKIDFGDNVEDFIKLQLPLNREDLKNLKAGDKGLLSGPVYALRDAGHIRLLEEMDGSEKLPYGLDGQTIFYAGPTPAKGGRPFGAIGPTTASRMDFAASKLYAAGITATIGKGRRSDQVAESCRKTGSVYFCAIGGSAAYLAKCVESSELIAYEDLGTEALRKCIVRDFPVYVAIDTNGNDIYN